MFKFLFGLVWTAFVTLIFIVCLVIPSEQKVNPLFFILLSLFEFVGLYMLISGLRKIIKDKKTKKHGIQCYAIVIDIYETGSYINNNPEYKAILNFLNPEKNQVETIEEIIGFDYNKYPINSYILCKYYQGDINLESVVFENEVPYDIKKCLVPEQQVPAYFNLEFSSDSEFVTIDGVRYKKQ